MEEEKKSDTIQLPEQPGVSALYLETIYRGANTIGTLQAMKFASQTYPSFRVYRDKGQDYFSWMWTIGGVCFAATGVIDHYEDRDQDQVEVELNNRDRRGKWVGMMILRIEQTLEDLVRFMEKHLEIMKENIAADLKRYKAGDRTL